MVVMKFGGTSIANAERIREVAQLVEKSRTKEPTIVVLSAMKKVTDLLLLAAKLAVTNNNESDYKQCYQKIFYLHSSTWNTLMKHTEHKGCPVPTDIVACAHELKEILDGIFLIKECTQRTQDVILSFGERLSCGMFAEYLSMSRKSMQGVMVDARKCIRTNNMHGNAVVDFDKSYTLLKKHIGKLCMQSHTVPIVTGFIGATDEGVTTTLGRNGSDYTASLVGAALHVDRIEIWTDVDGILSADPRVAKDAFVVPKISYSEAMELSYFGATVIHPHTVVPAKERQVPIIIKNTMNPQADGTVIEKDAPFHRFPITGVASVRKVSLLTIEGAGLSGNFYFLPDVFNEFASQHIVPLMITQSSSEHSICFVIREEDALIMKSLLEKKFAIELKGRLIQQITVKNNTSIISIIGSHMKGTKGLAGRIFSVMGTHDINVIAIAQGSNEMNVSFVVKSSDESLAIEILHQEFFSRTHKKNSGRRTSQKRTV